MSIVVRFDPTRPPTGRGAPAPHLSNADRRPLTAREIEHRRRMLAHLKAQARTPATTRYEPR